MSNSNNPGGGGRNGRRVKTVSGRRENSEMLGRLLTETKDMVSRVKDKGIQKPIEDAKMFRELCKTVRELFEDTNTNEVKFNLNEYSEMIGKYSNAVQDNGDVKLNKNQFLVLAKRFKAKFARVPTFKFIQGAIDIEVGEVKKRKPREKRPERQLAVATKTAIVTRSQAGGQQGTSKLVESTGKILERQHSQNNKRQVDTATLFSQTPERSVSDSHKSSSYLSAQTMKIMKDVSTADLKLSCGEKDNKKIFNVHKNFFCTSSPILRTSIMSNVNEWKRWTRRPWRR